MGKDEYVPDMQMHNFQNMRLKDFVEMIQDMILEKTKLKPILICKFPYLSQVDLGRVKQYFGKILSDYHMVCIVEPHLEESKFEVLWEKDMTEETKEELNKIFHNFLQSIKQKEEGE